VLSAPSGTGKTTIARALLEADTTIERSISMTTRARRSHEIDGEDYIFTTEPMFRSLIGQGQFLEWAEVHSDLYGTSRASVETIIRDGRIALMVIDVQGGQSIKTVFPDAVLVFLMPPSIESLANRLRKRGTEDESVIQSRLAQAEIEIRYSSQYTYGVVNEDGEKQQAVDQIHAIIAAERCRINRWETS
ncbi:uncharacterized protein METZ01_LOCUS179766, partial [marine metagenome]